MGLKDRRRLSFAGHVAVNVVLDDRYELAGDPDIVAIGVPETDKRGDVIEDLMLSAASGAVDSIPRQRRKDFSPCRVPCAARCAQQPTRPGARSRW